MSDSDVHGPVDFLLLEFPDGERTGKPAEALFDLVDRGIVRVYDLLVLRKAEDGAVSGVEITDLSAEDVGGFTAFAGARSGLLGDDDARQAAEAMKPGTVAALLMYENAQGKRLSLLVKRAARNRETSFRFSDDHGARVCPDVWALYRRAVARFGWGSIGKEGNGRRHRSRCQERQGADEERPFSHIQAGAAGRGPPGCPGSLARLRR